MGTLTAVIEALGAAFSEKLDAVAGKC